MTGPTGPGAGWTFLRIVGALPFVPRDPRFAAAAQVAVFGAGGVGAAAYYGAWRALPLAVVAVLVSAIGSVLMGSLSRRIRALDPPPAYRGLLFDSGFDVVMGLVAFIALVSYLLVDGIGPGSGLVERLLGPSPPGPAVFLGLVLAWDLTYRIGIGWWASVTGLWRAIRFTDGMDRATRTAYARADSRTIAFAAVQLPLVAVLPGEPVLRWLVVAHVLAVVLVSGLAIVLGRGR